MWYLLYCTFASWAYFPSIWLSNNLSTIMTQGYDFILHNSLDWVNILPLPFLIDSKMSLKQSYVCIEFYTLRMFFFCVSERKLVWLFNRKNLLAQNVVFNHVVHAGIYTLFKYDTESAFVFMISNILPLFLEYPLILFFKTCCPLCVWLMWCFLFLMYVCWSGM